VRLLLFSCNVFAVFLPFSPSFPPKLFLSTFVKLINQNFSIPSATGNGTLSYACTRNFLVKKKKITQNPLPFITILFAAIGRSKNLQLFCVIEGLLMHTLTVNELLWLLTVIMHNW
jgi:hypothetical protein